jgi:uridine monophosphate synthetase
MLVSVSRSLATATDPAAEARSLREAINDVRRRLSPRRTVGGDARQIASTLLRAGCVRFGQFTLRSGQRSSIYLDLRRLASHPWALRVVAAAFVRLLRPLEFDRLAAIPYAALPIGTAVALAGDWPLIYPRRETKAHGTRSVIEGEYHPGETVVVLDDLITTGESKFETIQKLESAGLQVRDLVVLVARGQEADEAVAAAGYCLHAAVDLPRLLCEWREMGAVTPEQYSELMVDLE